MFSHSNAVSTPTRNVNLARILTALTKARIYNQHVRNCFSIISVFVMLIKLYYDLETCGIIIVRHVWYIRIFIIRVSAFSIIVFLSNTTHQGHFIVLGHYIKNYSSWKKNIIELWRNECRYFHVPCILQHKEYNGKMEYK
jgi:hypothetical protein